MKIIEASGVEPAFADMESALIYAKGRFGGASGEIRIYDSAGETVVETIMVDGGAQYGTRGGAGGRVCGSGEPPRSSQRNCGKRNA